MTMRYEDLLEKKEAKQIELIKYVLQVGGSERIQVLTKELNVSKASLEGYIEDLNDTLSTFQHQITIFYDGQIVMFTLAPECSLRCIEEKIYKQAIKYQILMYLYEHTEYTVVLLTQELGMSESTVFRKIKELNQLLKEFEIEIWQGKLVGEESQIRYFYYCFFSSLNIRPKDMISRNRMDFIRLIESGLSITLSPLSIEHIELWLSIAKKRINVPNQQFKQFRKQFKAYERDPYFKLIRSMVIRVLGYYAIDINEEESMIHFAFLVSFDILSPSDFYQYDILRSRFTPTAIVDTFILETIILDYRPLVLSHDLESKVYYYLSRIHSRLYFFKGNIDILSLPFIWESEKTWSARVLKPEVERLFNEVVNRLPYDKKDSLADLTKLTYLNILAIIDGEINMDIKVGIDLHLEDVFKEGTYQRIKAFVDKLNGVNCQLYYPEKDYDLVISNREYLKYKCRVYVITELGTTYDLNNIIEVIREISLVK